MATPAAHLREVMTEDGARLRDVQTRLATLDRTLADDPWRAFEAADERARLVAERDLLLARWSRAALAWLMRGGEVVLQDPTGDRAGSITGVVRVPEGRHPAVIRAAPAPAPDLSRLSEAMRPGWTSAQQSAPRPADPVPDGPLATRVLASLAVHPEDISGPDGLTAEIERLTDGITPETTALWLKLPRAAQQALVGHVVARARYVQDERDPDWLTPAAATLLDRIFSAMTAYSKREQPGFVFGLMRTHTPVHGSWDADARSWWGRVEAAMGGVAGNPEKALDALAEAIEGGEEDEIEAAARAALDADVDAEDPRLVDAMMPFSELLKKSARFKKLRRAIRVAEAPEEDSDDDDSESPLPDDWGWWSLVRGKRATMVGGDLREDARKRIQDTFGFSMLDWVTTDHSRQLKVLATAIEGGSIEFVILLRRFIGHDVDRIIIPACKAAGVPWVSVERGYGVTQIARTIERYQTDKAEVAR